MACAVALTALGGTASASASTWSAYDLSAAASGVLDVGRPAAFEDPGNGQALAFLDTPAGHLVTIAGAGPGPVAAYDLTGLSGGQAITGDPTPVVDPGSGYLLAVADSPNGHLIQFGRAPTGGWTAYDLTALASGGVTIAGDPAPIVDPQNGELLVIADGSNGHLLSFTRSPSGAWTVYDLTNLSGGGTITGDPVPVMDPQNHDLLVVARGTNGHVEEFDRTSSSFVWTPYDLTGATGGPSITGDPVPLVNPADGDLLVFADATGGHLVVLDRNAASFVWSYDDLTSATSQPVVGNPDPAVDPQTHGLLAFEESPSEHLVEFAAVGGSWSADDLTATAGAPAIAAQPQVLRSPASGDLLVYVTTPGEHVVELDRSQPAPPTQSQPIPVSVPPSRARGHVNVRISITWTWRGARTLIHRVRFSGLRRGAIVRVGCAGRGCPWRRALSADRRRVGRLLRALDGRVLHAGDRLQITIREPRLIPERVRVRIRAGRRPVALLL